MNRTSVSSSDIASIGYDKENEILEIEFLRVEVYQYSGVPEGEYNGLMSAESHGKYFSKNIKNTYSFIKL